MREGRATYANVPEEGAPCGQNADLEANSRWTKSWPEGSGIIQDRNPASQPPSHQSKSRHDSTSRRIAAVTH